MTSVPHSYETYRRTCTPSGTHRASVKCIVCPDQVRKLQRQIEERSTPRSSRERSTGRRSSDLDREQARQLRQANDKLEELAKEIKVLKEREAKSSKGYRLQDAESFIQALVKENKLLKREVEELKAANRKLSDRRADFVKEEVNKS
ncbi:hypothetical protein J6590_059050 [Homalodisca vitripennis]|nr:hypothetical protein J6590_059050 [Homalodisca vitripennis]